MASGVRRYIVITSKKPGDAIALLRQIVSVSSIETLRIALFAEQGVSSDERSILRSHRWMVKSGGAAEAEADFKNAAGNNNLKMLASDSLVRVLPHLADAIGKAASAQRPPPKVKIESKPRPRRVREPLKDKPDQPPQPVQRPAPTPVRAQPPTALPSRAKKRMASFMVATHRRPMLLEQVLQHLRHQRVPAGWSYDIMVCGRANDPGRAVVARTPGVTYHIVQSNKVTDKLNHLSRQTQAELLLMADDDDLQSDRRLEAAVGSFVAGHQWSASGTHRFVNRSTGALARWTGPARSGYVGTTVSISRALFLRVGGYPSVAAGKDGHLAFRINKVPGTKFGDISTIIGDDTYCLQHESNINTRPFPSKGRRVTKGKFGIEGLGDWSSASIPAIVRESLRVLSAHPGTVPTPTVPLALDPVSLITCTDAGPGQSALIDGLRELGVRTGTIAQCEAAMRKGLPALFHGWGRQYANIAKIYPGKMWVLWHSGLTGTDLMGEKALATVLHLSQSGLIKLLWLERRDVLLKGATHFTPVWSPTRLGSMSSGNPKQPGTVMVGFHGKYPTAAKNSLAGVAGVVDAGAVVHHSSHLLTGSLGATYKKVLEPVKSVAHAFLPRPKAMALVSEMELLVHVSTSDTWPYLVLEAVHLGTPVVISDVVGWSNQLPQWAQDLCIVRPHTSSAVISQKVRHLMSSPQDRRRLLAEQVKVLNRLAAVNKAEAHRRITTLLGNKTWPSASKPPSLTTQQNVDAIIKKEMRRRPSTAVELQAEVDRLETEVQVKPNRPVVLVVSTYRFMSRTIRLIKPLLVDFQFRVVTWEPSTSGDLVWSLYPFQDGILGATIKKNSGVPFVQTLRGQFWHSNKAYQGTAIRVLSAADRVVVVAGNLARDMVHRFPMLRNQTIVTIPNGGYLEYQTTSSSQHPSIKGFKNPLLVCLTNFQMKTKRDGVDALVNALDQAGFQGTFVVAASPDSPHAPPLGQLGRCGQYIGFVDDAAKLLNSASVFFYWSGIDGQPSVMMEAMSAALPTVVGDGVSTGASEFVREGETGYVFSTAKEGARMAMELAANPRKCIRMGQAARKLVENEYRWEQMADSYRQIFQDLLET